MTPIEKLHTFARRWCLERIAGLRETYNRAKQQGVTAGDGSIFARIHVLEAIQLEVERLTPADFTSRQHASLRLIEIGNITPLRPARQRMWQKPHELQLIGEERGLFAEAVRQLVSQADWKHWSVEPLPYRRTLQIQETADLMEQMRVRWSITKRWWVPFEKYDLPYEALVLDSTAIRDGIGVELLRSALAKHGVARLYELHEQRNEADRELGLELWDPYKAFWTEKYWLTNEMDWLYYITHENSTTIAGDWLLAIIKAAWPAWEENQWIAPWKKPQ